VFLNFALPGVDARCLLRVFVEGQQGGGRDKALFSAPVFFKNDARLFMKAI